MLKRLLSLTTVAILLVPSFASAESALQIDEEGAIQPPPGVEFWTDNPNLNAKILSGDVKVSIYEEPSQAEKAAIDSKLQELGYPESYISDTPWAIKELVVSDNLEWVSPSVTPMNLDGVTPTSLDGNGWIVWTYNQYDKSDSTTNRYELSSYWNWNKMPIWTDVDKIGWAWAADDTFGYEQGSLENYQFFNGCSVLNECVLFQVENNITSDQEPGKGVGTEVDLLGSFYYNGTKYFTTSMWGRARVNVVRARNHSGQQGTFTTTSRYFHKQLSCNGELSFTGGTPKSVGAGIGISCSWAYDASSSPGLTSFYTD